MPAWLPAAGSMLPPALLRWCLSPLCATRNTTRAAVRRRIVLPGPWQAATSCSCAQDQVESQWQHNLPVLHTGFSTHQHTLFTHYSHITHTLFTHSSHMARTQGAPKAVDGRLAAAAAVLHAEATAQAASPGFQDISQTNVAVLALFVPPPVKQVHC